MNHEQLLSKHNLDFLLDEETDSRNIINLINDCYENTWKPIETAPTDGSRVIIYSIKHGVKEAKFRESGEGYTLWYDNIVGGGPLTLFYDVTHWMPLPKPPKLLDNS